MPRIFAVSDTWFNRILDNEPNVNVVENNDEIIENWNNTVDKDDVVYVLGGFGIGDLYHILVRLNGEIHFLNNYFNDEEKEFMETMKTCLDKSSDQEFKKKIIFETDQVMVLKEQDSVLSYFPLLDWCGKETGTYCFHGLNEDIELLDHSITCVSKKWKKCPVNIKLVQENIDSFSDLLED